jgi:hypothetical protein
MKGREITRILQVLLFAISTAHFAIAQVGCPARRMHEPCADAYRDWHMGGAQRELEYTSKF